MKFTPKRIIFLIFLITFVIPALLWEYFHYQITYDISQTLSGIVYTSDGNNIRNMDIEINGKLYANRLGCNTSYFEGEIKIGGEKLTFDEENILWLDNLHNFNPDSGYNAIESTIEWTETNKLRKILGATATKTYVTIIGVGKEFQSFFVRCAEDDLDKYIYFAAPCKTIGDAKIIKSDLDNYTAFHENKFLSYINYVLRKFKIDYQFKTTDY